MSDRLQTNVCSFFVSGQKRGFMRRCRPETKETAFAAIGHFRFFVRMPAAAKRSDEHREANSAYLSESLSRAAKNIAALIAIFSTSQTPFSQKQELRGENRLTFIGRPASAAHFDSDILHKKSNRKNRLLFYFTYALLLQLPHLGDTHNLVRRGQFFVAVGDNQQFVAQ